MDYDCLVGKAWNFLCNRKEAKLLQSCSKCYRDAGVILYGVFGPYWQGRTFSQLRRFGFSGFTYFYIKAVHPFGINVNIMKALIELDCNYEKVCLSTLIADNWSEIITSENSDVLTFLCDKCPDENYLRANVIMGKELGQKWVRSTFSKIRTLNWTGFAHYLLHKMITWKHDNEAFNSSIESLFELIDIDEQYGTSFGQTISVSWKSLVQNENLLISVLRKSDSDYARATEILHRKLGLKWQGQTYEKLRSSEYSYGYTCSYLIRSANIKQCSSSANFKDMKTLARIDLRKGTTIPELVFSCCQFFPKKTALKKMINIGKEFLMSKEASSQVELAKEVFSFSHQTGYSCLMSLFNFAAKYVQECRQFPGNQPMMREIEDSFFFLIQYAESNSLDMKTILNATSKSGITLFFLASCYSERIGNYLLDHGVNVNSVDSAFQTPIFKVRQVRILLE